MNKTIRFFYTLVLLIAAPFLLLGLLKKKSNKPAIGKRWKELFGSTPPLSITSSETVWIHAVSVGEVIAVTPFVKALKEKSPTSAILLTTTTPTGAKQAEKLSKLIEHRYMPIDFPLAINSFLETIKPSKLIIVETELWPNTINAVANSGVPIYVLNARLSEKSFIGYKRIQWLFNTIAPKLTKVLCLHDEDKQRFKQLGIEPNKLTTTGSIKFDIEVNELDILEGSSLRKQFGDHRFVWVAASTHPGEDEQILAAHQKLLQKQPDALLVLVPRHPERFPSVIRLSSSLFVTAERTKPKETYETTQVYVANTMGEMIKILASADICFMGGSLSGNKVGGHNVLEPAVVGLPVIIGPSYFNFADITNRLIANKVCTVIKNKEELSIEIIKSSNNKEKLKTKGTLAKQIVKNNSGAISKSLNHIFR